jgi:hypothetical protein
MARIFMLQLVAKLILLLPGLRQRSVVFDVVQQMTEMPTHRFANLARMMFDWAYRCRNETTEEPVFSGTTFQVHGTRDLLLPIRLTNPDISISGGGHDLTMTHSAQINEILEGFVL